MTPPNNGDDWDQWGNHVLAKLDDHTKWLEKLDRRMWSVLVTVVILLLGFVFSLLKGT